MGEDRENSSPSFQETLVRMDRLNAAQRSYCMSQIRGSNTGPELIFRKALWKNGIRYRLHNKLTGRPDIVVPRHRIAIFVDGCFWHGCPIHGVKPRTNRRFWVTKLSRNIARDREVTVALRKSGWVVLRLWEHDVESKTDKCVMRVLKIVTSQKQPNVSPCESKL